MFSFTVEHCIAWLWLFNSKMGPTNSIFSQFCVLWINQLVSIECIRYVFGWTLSFIFISFLHVFFLCILFSSFCSFSTVDIKAVVIESLIESLLWNYEHVFVAIKIDDKIAQKQNLNSNLIYSWYGILSSEFNNLHGHCYVWKSFHIHLRLPLLNQSTWQYKVYQIDWKIEMYYLSFLFFYVIFLCVLSPFFFFSFWY